MTSLIVQYFLNHRLDHDELRRQMREIAAESVAGGAVGFSTSRLLGHRVPDGRCVPGTFASIPEYLAVADQAAVDTDVFKFQLVIDSSNDGMIP